MDWLPDNSEFPLASSHDTGFCKGLSPVARLVQCLFQSIAS